MNLDIPVIVFSTPDQVSPDISTPSLSLARRILRELDGLGAHLVLCSMKTRAEIEALQRLLEIRSPLVSEGGNAAFIPSGCFPFDVEGSREARGHRVLEFGRGQ